MTKSLNLKYLAYMSEIINHYRSCKKKFIVFDVKEGVQFKRNAILDFQKYDAKIKDSY